MMYEIDAERFRRAIKARGLSYSSASLAIGRSPGYCSTCIRTGKISESAVTALEKICGVKTDYLVTEEEKAEPDTAMLYHCIYSAISHAAKTILDDIGSDFEAKLEPVINRAVYHAVRGAIKQKGRWEQK